MFEMTNKYDFFDLIGTQLSWELLANGKPVLAGQIPLSKLMPGEKKEFEIVLPELKPTVQTEYFVNVYLKTTGPWGLLPKGHTLAAEQFTLPSLGGKGGISVAESHPVMTMNEDDSICSFSSYPFYVRFSKITGTITSWKFRDTELLVKGPVPNFRRAPTDNDIGNGMPKRCKPWFDASEKRIVTTTDIIKISDKETVVSFQFLLADSVAAETIVYRVLSDGKISVNATLKPLKQKLQELPRFGLNMQIDPTFTRLNWYGRGPWENYQDRNRSAFAGIYESTVDEQFTPYVRPQENGYKTDVRWMTLENSKHYTLKFTGSPLFSFSALPYTYDEMKGFFQGGRHLHDLQKSPFVDVNLDYRQMGVGGDDSWGARTHEEYTLPAGAYEYGFTMEAGIDTERAK
jgi:beta-galactosidase